jgi:flavin reductase (DIM6/NTAB) family NADH-FMN oxidoreductase RutF
MDASAPEEFDIAVRPRQRTELAEGIESPFDDVPEPEALELGTAPGADPAVEFRKTLGMFATGVTVITVHEHGRVHGMTANAFMSVSLRPPLVLISVDRRARMNQLLREGVHYGISVLESGQSGLSDHFAGRSGPGASEPEFELVRDTPLVVDALAHLVARVLRSYWGGDHSLFLGQVEYVRYGEGEPLLFHGGRYERLVRDPRVFAALPSELLEPLLNAGTPREFSDGELLMRIGEPGDSLYLIVEGNVRVERPGKIVRLGAGDLVGEIEVLNPGGGRIANITAEGDVRCLEVTRSDLVGALEADPRAAIALIEVLASRFRESG